MPKETLLYEKRPVTQICLYGKRPQIGYARQAARRRATSARSLAAQMPKETLLYEKRPVTLIGLYGKRPQIGYARQAARRRVTLARPLSATNALRRLAFA